MPKNEIIERKGKKNSPNLNLPYIQFRITPKDKEKWVNYAKDNGFKYVSNLIRYTVEQYIEKGEQPSNNKELLPFLKEFMSTMKESQNNYMNKVNELLETSKKKEEINIEPKHKEQFLKLLEKHSFTSEEISEIYNLPEPYVLDVLNELKELNIIKTKRLKGKILWEVFNNGI